tara:strand:- start:259 stop:1557 length:1299 start_codon:yes stop_codon:yes gene_type:complete
MILFLIYIVIAFIHNFLALIVPPIRYAKEIPNKFFSLLGIICSLTTFILIAVSILQPTHDKEGKRIIFEGFHKLPTLAKFFILFGLIIVGFMIYGFKSISYPNSGIANDIEYNKSMDWLYNILLSPFDYKKLNEEQKNEFKNYRIEHSVKRENDTSRIVPLGDFLKTGAFKVSILKLLLVLTVLAVVFYMVEKKGDNDKAFIWILGFLMFFSIRALLTHGLNKYIIEYMKGGAVKYAYLNTVNIWASDKWPMHYFLLFLASIAFGMFGFLSIPDLDNGSLKVPGIVGSVNALINNEEVLKKSDTAINSLNILSKDILDLSEFLMLFKKTIYLICVGVILFFTTLTLPFVLIITLLYIILRVLYIFICIPFIKGGNYFFKIMKDRYKILAYMLCIAVILNIHDRDIFSHNTKTVVYTMSGILGLIIIYNFVNE